MKKTKDVPSYLKIKPSDVRPAHPDIITSRTIGMEGKCISTPEIGLLSADPHLPTLPTELF